MNLEAEHERLLLRERELEQKGLQLDQQRLDLEAENVSQADHRWIYLHSDKSVLLEAMKALTEDKKMLTIRVQGE